MSPDTTYEFKLFTDYHKENKDSKLSITKLGKIGLSASFYREEHVSQYTHARYFFNEQENIIGVKLLKENKEGAFKIMHKKHGAIIAAKSFFNKHNIDYKEKVGKYDWKLFENNKKGKIYGFQI